MRVAACSSFGGFPHHPGNEAGGNWRVKAGSWDADPSALLAPGRAARARAKSFFVARGRRYSPRSLAARSTQVSSGHHRRWRGSDGAPAAQPGLGRRQLRASLCMVVAAGDEDGDGWRDDCEGPRARIEDAQRPKPQGLLPLT